MDRNYSSLQISIQFSIYACWHPIILITIFVEFICNQLSISCTSISIKALTCSWHTPKCLTEYISLRQKWKWNVLYILNAAWKGIGHVRPRHALNVNGVGCFVWIGRCTFHISPRFDCRNSLDIKTSRIIFAAAASAAVLTEGHASSVWRHCGIVKIYINFLFSAHALRVYKSRGIFSLASSASVI